MTREEELLKEIAKELKEMNENLAPIARYFDHRA